MKKVGHTSEFLFGIYWWTWNTNTYRSWDTGWDRQNFFLSFGPFFCSFTPLMILKTKTLKQWKKCLKIFCLPHLYHQQRSYDIWFLKYKVQQTIFCLFGPFLALSHPPPPPPWQPGKSKFWKIEKNNWGYYHFTNVHHKWQSSDVWFLRYGAGWTKFFCHFGLFFALLLLPDGPRKSRFWKHENNVWRYYYLKHVYHKSQSNDVWFLKYGVQQIEFFVILDHFFPFYPLATQKIKILQKWKNDWR